MKAWTVCILPRLFWGTLFLLLAGPLTVAQSQPADTVWEFWRDYEGSDKVERLLNSYAVGIIGGGCTGTMISPHIMLTAAHCGGPGLSDRTVQFYHIDEDAPGPAPQYQIKSTIYYAHSFPWQVFVNDYGIQDNDFMLWWMAEGSDGIPPGIRYGYLELSTGVVKVGDEAYNFWRNPYSDSNDPSRNLADTLYHSIGQATALGGEGGTDAPPHFTDYNIATLQGASGSAIVSAGDHTIIGVRARPDRAADTSYVLSLHDGDLNAVLDAVEYDLLMTEGSRDFRLLTFNTPLQRAQWRPALGTIGQVTMAKPLLQGAPAGWVGQVGGAQFGPNWYRACWNGWLQRDDNSNRCKPPPPGVYLEDFEDGQLNTTGVNASDGTVEGPGSLTDSVDLDDGGDDHNGNGGHSFFSPNGTAGITFSFDENVLGSLPKRVGVVWTDGDGETMVEAFDPQGRSLGTIGPVKIADGSHQGTDTDDRFFGFTHQAGIYAFKIFNTAGGIEVDIFNMT